jgi:hypothetical protein
LSLSPLCTQHFIAETALRRRTCLLDRQHPQMVTGRRAKITAGPECDVRLGCASGLAKVNRRVRTTRGQSRSCVSRVPLTGLCNLICMDFRCVVSTYRSVSMCRWLLFILKCGYPSCVKCIWARGYSLARRSSPIELAVTWGRKTFRKVHLRSMSVVITASKVLKEIIASRWVSLYVPRYGRE